MTRGLLFTMLLGCAPQAMTVTPEHPANPDAPTGRLAGPPPALRAGVADTSVPSETVPTGGHEHHEPTPQPRTEPTVSPSTAPPMDSKQPTTKKPKQPKPPTKQPPPKPKQEPPKQEPPKQPDHSGHH